MFFLFASCVLFSLSFLMQSVYATPPPPKKAPTGSSQTGSNVSSSTDTEGSDTQNNNSPQQTEEESTADEEVRGTQDSSNTNSNPKFPFTCTNDPRLPFMYNIDGLIALKSSGNNVPEYLTDAKVCDGKISVENEIFFNNSNMEISATDPSAKERPKIYFEQLNIANRRNVIFENLDISGFVQITGNANVTFKNCTINATKDCGVCIQGNSSCNFQNCKLQGGRSACVYVKEISNASFTACEIRNANNIGILVGKVSPADASIMDRSKAELCGCKFQEYKGCAIYVCNGAAALAYDQCEFAKSNGGAIILKNAASTVVNESKFDGCGKTAIMCTNSSITMGKGCEFSNLKQTAVRGSGKSKINIFNCKFTNIPGNAIFYDASTGMVRGCTFINNNTDYPAICVCNCGSSPSISECSIEGPLNCSAIAIRSKATPIIKNITIKNFNCKYPIISCSDFSNPTIDNIKLEDSEQLPRILLSNGAEIQCEALMPERKTIVLNYTGGTVYHSMIDNKDFMAQFNPAKDLIIEKKVYPPQNEKTENPNITEIEINPSMLSPKVTFSKLCENDEATQLYPQLISDNCAHTLNVCNHCGNMCEASVNPQTKQFKRKCGVCKEETITKMNCPICELPFKNLINVFKSECILGVSEEEGPAQWIALPCGHKSLCDKCFEAYIKESGKNSVCPYCQAKGTIFKANLFHWLTDDNNGSDK